MKANKLNGASKPNKLLELLGLGVFIAVFFYSAFSTLHIAFKLLFIAVSLFASGAIIARLTNSSNHYGLVIIKGKYGFELMKSIAQQHPKLVNALADLGLSIGFGALYSIFLFHKTPKKLLGHLAVLVLLFASASFSSTVSVNPLVLQGLGFFFGLAGMGLISIALNAFNILTIPGTPAGVLPVVPGVTVPWEAIFAIALIAVVHETAHGVLFFIEKLKVMHSGILLLGFLPIGAFVEPDEKQFAKHEAHGRRRILVAGSASNFYTTILLLPFLAVVSLVAAFFVSGVLISEVTPGAPAHGLLSTGDVVTSINGVSTKTSEPFIKNLQAAGANSTVLLGLSNGREASVKLNEEGKMGIGIENYVSPANSLLYGVAAFFASVLNWSVLLSLALSIINLLPLFITDGHHLISDEVSRLFPSNPQLAKLTTKAFGAFMLLLLLLNLLPFVK